MSYRILILDQGRQALPFISTLARNGCSVEVVCNSRLSETYLSRFPVKRHLWPKLSEKPDAFLDTLLNYLRRESIDVTLSLGDASAELLCKNRECLSRYTALSNPDFKTFLQATDKLSLMRYCADSGIPAPKTIELSRDSVEQIDGIMGFPVIVKPVHGIGAIGVIRFDSVAELKDRCSALLHKYGTMLVQEYIPQSGGMQYQAEAFLDLESKMKACVVIDKPRFFPVSGGTSTANVTVARPDITALTRELLEGLNWIGAADVDFILDPRCGTVKVLEVNPRVTAGIKIAFAAGVDFADLHMRLALGKPIPEVFTYKIGVYCRNLVMDTLWYLFASRRMRQETSPSFWKFLGKDVVEQTFSLNDPFTGIGFILNKVNKNLTLRHLRSKLKS